MKGEKCVHSQAPHEVSLFINERIIYFATHPEDETRDFIYEYFEKVSNQ